MNMFPHTVTVYRTAVETDPDTLEDTVTNEITVLRGVLLDTSKGSSVRGEQSAGADEVTLYVPFRTADRLDIAADGTAFFVKGEVVEPEADRAVLEKIYGHVYSVTRVDELDYGGLRHWEIGGE